MSHKNSFYWFDYETYGTHPAWDRPCQFAGLRTDMELNEVEAPLVLYCRQPPDYLPHPAACRVTGLSPGTVNEKADKECTFIKRILDVIGKPGTCSLGYNSIRFDDEFTRHTLFRNFLDPYEYEYKDGNSRWDLLDIVRLTRALRPEGIHWPFDKDGKPSNRLELLSSANDIEHGQAHDALSDVRATIGMARLIREKQPRLFEFAFTNRTRQAVARRLDTVQRTVCLQVSGMIPSTRSHISAILPLALHPQNRNGVIVLDLHDDPGAWMTDSADDIARALFSPAGSTSPRPGLRTVQINKCPVIVPLNTMRPEDAERLGFDSGKVQAHARLAETLIDKPMQEKIQSVMQHDTRKDAIDVDGSLYTGAFLSPADRQRATLIRTGDPVDISAIGAHFEDKRLVELSQRYQARNFPDTLTPEQHANWKAHCADKLDTQDAPWLSIKAFDRVMAEQQWLDSESGLRNELQAYRDDIVSWFACRRHP